MMFPEYGFGFVTLWSLLTMLVFLAGLALLAVLAFRAFRPRYGPPGTPPSGPVSPPRDPALELLRHRFAAGEIDQAEYESKRRLLEGEEKA